MIRRLAPLPLIGLLALPAGARARVDLTSAGGFLFDVAEPVDFSPGSLGNGSADAYDTCYRLRVEGMEYAPTGATVTSLGGRQLELPAQTLAGLSVRRLVYVPAAGGDYARYLEVLENAGASPVTASVEVLGNLGSDASTVTSGTSSGDDVVDPTDVWFATDDAVDGGGDPSLAHVFGGPSAPLSPSDVALAGDNIAYTWTVTVPPGGRVVLLHFAVQAMTRSASLAAARRLVDLPDDALVGADPYLDDVLNFALTSPGAPHVRFSGPFVADEGAGLRVDVDVSDPEGDPFTFSWDLDDDGVFGERPGERSHAIAAGATDGPALIRLGVRAVDAAGHESRRFHTLRVVNVAPRVLSTPPAVISVGAELAYRLEVEDPGGALDPPSYALLEGPPGMTVNEAGVVLWTPGESDVTPPGAPLPVEVEVDDGDGGVTSQRWELAVSPNHAPSLPVPAYPIERIAILDRMPRLATRNAEDPDLDPLGYTFQLDRVESFDSPDLLELRAEEMPGFTSVEVPAPLAVDRLYHWRVRADDGVARTAWATASFWVVHDPRLPWDAGPADAAAGPDGGPRLPDAGPPLASGGCAAGASRGRPAPSLPLLLLGLLALRRRRAKRRP